MTRSQEQRLIANAAAGDRAASDTLIRAHQQGVYAYILRLSGRHDVAEDVVQEAFVRVLLNLDRFDTRFRFSTWLFTIARRVFLNAIEKRKPASDSDRVGEASGHGRAVGTEIEASERQTTCKDAVQKALLTLSMEQREVIVLFHQHEWPIWLIAEHLRMPEGTVKSHLHRGRVKLREALERDAAEVVVLVKPRDAEAMR
ncbi:MAG: RNA polymerase sigma factor [Planctomycetota bacterium]|nr:RNA polymerase sigma factor [Planctomycetota bacterium]